MPRTPTANEERFVTYTFLEDWPELKVAINEYEIRLRSRGRPLAANLLVKAYAQMRDELRVLAYTMQARGTELLVEEEKKTRVRGDTAGGGGPRLEDHLHAEAIDQQLMPGSVGIADLDELDAEVPWWITNEIGSSARVGGRLYGVFYGEESASPPDASRFREHPLFESGNDSGLAGVGYIENPIPARWFIKRAAPRIEAEWRAGFQRIKDRFDAELVHIETTPL